MTSVSVYTLIDGTLSLTSAHSTKTGLSWYSSSEEQTNQVPSTATSLPNTPSEEQQEQRVLMKRTYNFTGDDTTE